MKVEKKLFGNMPDGKPIFCWKICEENGIQVEILSYGATIHKLLVPDKKGNLVDVVLGYEHLDDYIRNNGYFGATVGRFANRIKDAKFELGEKRHQLTQNIGKDHVHGGKNGFDKVIWDTELVENGVRFSYLSSDNEEGYPGNLQVSVTMSVENHGLQLRYYAISDQDTILNLTNHSYFNLNGTGNIHNQMLCMNAEKYLVTDERYIPTGEIASVSGTAMDFRNSRAIGASIDNDEQCVKKSGGYNANYILTGEKPNVIAYSEKSGIVMKVYTDQPGVQLYTANNISKRIGKNGECYEHRSGFCIETQHYPDCVHHPEWPSAILKAGDVFESTTTYQFDNL